MTRIVTQAEKNALAAVSSEHAQALLRYILSPIEKAAILHGFKPFQHTINGAKIYLNRYSCRRLLFTINDKLNLLNFSAEKEHKSVLIPLHLREVFDDPAEILGLPAHARNRLCAIECYSMFAAMQLGRQFFVTWPGFGKRSLSTLDALFAKHNCAHLFV